MDKQFCSSFKKYRSDGWKDLEVSKGFIIRLVATKSYKKNLGFGRFYKDVVFSRNAKKRFASEPKPNVIVSAENPLTMGIPTFPYAKKNLIPVVVDQMDIWPEFIEKSAGKYGKFVHFFLKPVYRNRKKNYEQAAGYLALGKNYLEFSRKVAPNSYNKPFALVYNGVDVKNFRKHLASSMSENVRVQFKKSQGKIKCIFAGTFGPSYDISVMIGCAQKCKEQELDVDFLFAGSGPCVVDVQKAAQNTDNIIYLGSLLPSELVPIYGNCHIGLCAYSKFSNVDMPDKFYDYCAAGLAIVNSLTNEVASFIANEHLGLNYEGGNLESMFSAIEKITNDEKILEEARHNSKQIGTVFDSSIQNEYLHVLLQKVVAGNNS